MELELELALEEVIAECERRSGAIISKCGVEGEEKQRTLAVDVGKSARTTGFQCGFHTFGVTFGARKSVKTTRV